jgi:hypothetical protein
LIHSDFLGAEPVSCVGRRAPLRNLCHSRAASSVSFSIVTGLVEGWDAGSWRKPEQNHRPSNQRSGAVRLAHTFALLDMFSNILTIDQVLTKTN